MMKNTIGTSCLHGSPACEECAPGRESRTHIKGGLGFALCASGGGTLVDPPRTPELALELAGLCPDCARLVEKLYRSIRRARKRVH